MRDTVAAASILGLFVAPALADRYSGPAPSFDTRLIAECLFDSFVDKMPLAELPNGEACLAAIYPCHASFDLPPGPDMSFDGLTADTRHQLEHCLFDHLEEAEWIAFRNVTSPSASALEFDHRVVTRFWMRQLRNTHENCARRFPDATAERVSCNLEGTIEHVADPEVVIELRETLEKEEDSK